MEMIRRNFLIFFACFILALSSAGSIGFCEPPNGAPTLLKSMPLELKQGPALDGLSVPVDNRAFQRLEREVRRLAVMAGGTVGMSALHIESGRSFSLNGTERFPLASAYKIPIAVQLLSMVDRGEITLDQVVTLRNCDIHPGSGKLIQSFKKKAVSHTVKELLELMLIVSDNTASDALLELAGGAKAVTSSMQAMGIKDLEVSRSTLKMLADWRGIEELPAAEDFSVDKYNKLRKKVPADVLEKAQNRFYYDIRDTATPDAMTSLLARVYLGAVLKSESSSLLLKIMERCQTGKSRIKKLMPPGMATADKTGTIGRGIVNDAALLTLPDNAGHVALTIFIKTSEQSVAQQENIMAQIARYCYDYYYFYDTTPAMASRNESCPLQDPNCYR